MMTHVGGESQQHNLNANQIFYLPRAVPSIVKVEYPKKSRVTIKWLCVIQLILSVSCTILQAVTVGFEDVFTSTTRFSGLYTYDNNGFDRVGTGIWAGSLMIATSAIGIAAWRQNRKSLIITHIVFNAIILILSTALVGTSVGSVYELKTCRKNGMQVRSYGYEQGRSKVLFGEDLKSEVYTNFFCKHAMFQAWLACESILLGCAVMMFVVSLTLLIFNSKAACVSCCSRGCCGGCSQNCGGCCCDPALSTPVPIVAYQPQNVVSPHGFVSGSSLAYPIYGYPSAPSSSAPTINPLFPYQPSFNAPVAPSQGNFTPAEEKSAAPLDYSGLQANW